MMTAEQIKDVARTLIEESKDLFILSTVDDDGCPHSRYMGAMVREGEFEFLLPTHMESRKVAQIRQNPNAQVVFASRDYACVVTLSGSARTGVPVQKKAEVWEKIPGLKQHFDSYLSPKFCVIRFKAHCLEFLTTKDRYTPMRVEL